jgi:hypothetical protein
MLLQEALGLTTDRSSWVHLSDGGHFENLALYEMVRRRCHFIVAVDAGCDPDREFEDLGGAIRKVRIDFGIPIEMSGVNVGVNTGDGQTRCAIGRIQYSAVDKVRRRLDGREVEEPAPDGFLLYVKPSVFDADPVDVRNYREANPEFPHESTGDQFFSESQFESYRALGFRTIQDVFSMAHAQSPKSLLDAFRAAQVFVNSRGSRGAFTIE